ncbi:MAG: GNAT family N-acetyltransferase [Tissierellia bacterium]|nr:GNAT family N-acetyltransferase [Tissierellia bacterium]
MEIRKSTYDDVYRMLEIFKEAREFMKENGNPNQWGEAYPPKSLLLQDIEEGNSYVCIKDGIIVGTFYYKEGEDPTYKKIYDGQWLNDKPYGVVHRIATARGTRGVGSFCLDWCFNQSGNLKIDTHRDNIPMQRLLAKLGFNRCGIIYIENGEERIAYQKTLE